MNQTLDDWYKQCEKLDRLTWKNLCDRYSDKNRELVKILCEIADKLGVYEEARSKWQFLQFSDENQIFKKLGIIPEKGMCENFEIHRKNNERRSF